MRGSKRSVINMNLLPEWQRDFIFIDLLRASLATTAGYFDDECDEQGWALNNSLTGRQSASARVAMPDTYWWTDGPNPNVYVLTGLGEGVIQFGVTQHCTFRELGGYNFSGANGSYTVRGTATNRWRIVIQRTDRVSIWASAGNNYSFLVNRTTNGKPITDVHIYRLDDEADFVGQSPAPTAGKFTIVNHFRTIFKKVVVDWNPCAIRFMNWMSPAIRWSNRTPPRAFFSGQSTPVLKPLRYGFAYHQTSPSIDKTRFLVDGVSGTPATYQHGEVCYAGFHTDYVTPGGTTHSGAFFYDARPDDLNQAHTKLRTNIDMTVNFH